MQKYKVIKEVGQGTYSHVYQAINTENNEFVAIKIFKAPESADDPEYLKVIKREMRMLRLSKHPLVVDVIEAFKRNRTACIVFEYCESTLLNLIEEHLLDEFTTKLLVFQLFYVAAYLHGKRIVHRDLKPENILIMFQKMGNLHIHGYSVVPVVKLCDFGFSRSMEPGPARLTQYTSTRWYRSPEQLLGQAYDEKIDIWSIGCIIYEMLTGKPLFPGETDLHMIALIQRELGSSAACSNSPLGGKDVGSNNFGKKVAHFEPEIRQILQQCLRIDASQRVSARQVCNLQYFNDCKSITKHIIIDIQEEKANNDSIEILCSQAQSMIARSETQLAEADERLQHTNALCNIPSTQQRKQELNYFCYSQPVNKEALQAGLSVKGVAGQSILMANNSATQERVRAYLYESTNYELPTIARK